MSKKITVKCHGPIAANRKYKSLWEDVWLSWTGKPGRTKYYSAPCLIGKLNAEDDHELNLDCVKKYPETDWDDEIAQSKSAIEAISRGEIYIDDPKSDIPNVYTSKDLIDRKEAELMIAEVMKLHGFKEIRYKWIRPKIVVIPM